MNLVQRKAPKRLNDADPFAEPAEFVCQYIVYSVGHPKLCGACSSGVEFPLRIGFYTYDELLREARVRVAASPQSSIYLLCFIFFPFFFSARLRLNLLFYRARLGSFRGRLGKTGTVVTVLIYWYLVPIQSFTFYQDLHTIRVQRPFVSER